MWCIYMVVWIWAFMWCTWKTDMKYDFIKIKMEYKSNHVVKMVWVCTIMWCTWKIKT